MNARKNNRVTTRVALSAITVVLSQFLLQEVLAAESPGNFHMVVIENKAQGRLVVKGEYDRAIRRLELSTSRRFTFEKANNLCVAYLKSKDLDKAEASCDAAIAEAGADGASPVKMASAGNEGLIRNWAIALSNRGVLRAVTGQHEEAREDFAQAVKLFGDLDEFHTNMAYLDIYDSINKATAQNTR